jgi:hypothetical protein
VQEQALLYLICVTTSFEKSPGAQQDSIDLFDEAISQIWRVGLNSSLIYETGALTQ